MNFSIKFRKNFYILIKDEGKLEIGKACFFNNGCSINCLGSISIGNYCLFGENVKLYDHNHRFINKKVLIKDQGFTIGNIIIGDNCWIGSNVVILKDVVIGDNVIIGANTLVYKSIQSNTIVKTKSEMVIRGY